MYRSDGMVINHETVEELQDLLGSGIWGLPPYEIAIEPCSQTFYIVRSLPDGTVTSLDLN